MCAASFLSNPVHGGFAGFEENYVYQYSVHFTCRYFIFHVVIFLVRLFTLANRKSYEMFFLIWSLQHIYILQHSNKIYKQSKSF